MKNLERVFDLVLDPTIRIEGTYVQSYPHMIDYFKKIKTLTVSDVVIGAHMIYGWMPTILRVDKKKTDPQEVVRILQAVKDEKDDLSVDDLITLKQYMNNSIVGASKILHFVAPEQYPIWDSKIFRFTHQNQKEPSQNRVNNALTYMKYREKLHALMNHPSFTEFHNTIEEKLGYSVSGLRALELAMFLNQEA